MVEEKMVNNKYMLLSDDQMNLVLVNLRWENLLIFDDIHQMSFYSEKVFSFNSLTPWVPEFPPQILP
jgi:hypothetical protein